MYPGAQELQFIGNYDLKPLWQIFSIDSHVNLPCGENFLYKFFFFFFFFFVITTWK